MTSVISMILVDRNTLFREGLARIFANSSYKIEASASSLGELRDFRIKGSQPLLLLVGLDVDPAGTLGMLQEIKAQFSSCRIVVLADNFVSDHASIALRSGVDGFLLKAISFEELQRSLDVILSGKTVFSRGLDLFGSQWEQKLVKLPEIGAESNSLSGRETEIVQCLVRGEPNKAIARRFGIAEATVKVHVKAILRKLNASNRTQAAMWALDNQRLFR
jgi:two-component system, NarL family, nitrate/nitrite response regulator NarL